MLRGFIGQPATTYLGGVSNAHTNAANATANASSRAPANAPPDHAKDGFLFALKTPTLP